MNVVPMFPDSRFYCSDCEVHFYDFERHKHEKCCPQIYCPGCQFALQPGDADQCQRCGAALPVVA